MTDAFAVSENNAAANIVVTKQGQTSLNVNVGVAVTYNTTGIFKQ